MSKRYIVGLGNPGEEYEDSRHNAGFLVLDGLAKVLNLSWKFDKKFNAEIARAPGSETFLIKPMTYMNDSGSSVRAVMAYEKDEALVSGSDAELKNLCVIYDDLDLQLGQRKMQFATHPKIHNGVNSIISSLGTDKFWNIRIGTDTRDGDRAIPSKEFVLKPLNTAERSRLAEVIGNVVQEVHASLPSS